MPMSNELREEYNKAQRDDMLHISALQFYNTKVRPHMKDMLFTCRTDPELIRTITSTMNKVDGEMVRSNWSGVEEGFSVLNMAITDANYFYGVISRASENEKNKVRELSLLIKDLFLIMKAEKPPIEKEPEKRERLNYQENEADPYRGQNRDYLTHNMAKLTIPDPKPRIPNK